MNNFRPTVGIEFEDRYLEAKNKLIDFMKALHVLTPAQNEELSMELLTAMGIADSFETLISMLNKGGHQ